MRRNTSPAAAPTPTSPAPSHTMASGTSGSGPVDETARPGSAGSPAACGARVGRDWRALMDRAVGRSVGSTGADAVTGSEDAWLASAAVDPAMPEAAAPGIPAAPAVPVPDACAPPACATASGSVPDAPDGGTGAGACAPAPTGAPTAGAVPDAGDLPGAGAVPGTEAAEGPASVGDPGEAGTGEDGAGEDVAVGALACPPVTSGVPETIGSGRSGSGSAVMEAAAVARAVAVGMAVDREAVTAGRNAPGTAGRAGAVGRWASAAGIFPSPSEPR